MRLWFDDYNYTGISPGFTVLAWVIRRVLIDENYHLETQKSANVTVDRSCEEETKKWIKSKQQFL